MTFLVVPEFGCGSKLPLPETEALHALLGSLGVATAEGDFSVYQPTGSAVVTSIDRVTRCSASWSVFAEIAITHVENDVISAGAVPRVLSVAFEFGADATDAGERAAFVEAIGRVAAHRGLRIGKCHSTLSSSATAITASIHGDMNHSRGAASDGAVILSRPLGAFKMHYFAELRGRCDQSPFPTLFSPTGRDALVRVAEKSVGCTDVSGHGLWGALQGIAKTRHVSLSIALSTDNAYSDEVLSRSVECLDEPLLEGMSNSPAFRLAIVRETAGPHVFLAATSEADELLSALSAAGLAPSLIGRYEAGSPRVDLSWQS